jgi:hypothetical protein
MSYSSSEPIKIPLADPLTKYGKTFRISNILLASAGTPQTSASLPESSSSLAVYQAGFSSKNLNTHWNIIDPRNDYIYTRSSDIERSPYISGFNVDVYKNKGQLTGASSITGSELVFSQSGIKGNDFSYEITGYENWRNYSITVRLVDFTGNQSSGLLSTQNPQPNYAILSTGINLGFFTVAYSGRTGEGGGNTSNGLQSLNLYNFTGLTSGTSGYFSQESGFMSQSTRSTTGFNNQAAVELEPGEVNYVMQVSTDLYSTGTQSGFYTPVVYATGIGFSGASGVPTAPLPILYYPNNTNLAGYRISGGNAYYYTFSVNYPTGSSLLKANYEITGTGLITGAVSGYTGQIFLDKGLLYDPDYGVNNTGEQYVYDNSLSLQSGLFTGVETELQTVTGVGFSGSGTFGVGAGAYWKEESPSYSSYEMSGSGGFYGYGYFDTTLNKFGCVSYAEIKSGGINMPGMFSLPKNDPNSYDIKYRSGTNFRGGYERGASFLNTIGEMPAVIVNPSQFNKICSMSVSSGWVGLRRGRVGILTGLFSEDSVNQEFFSRTNFLTEESRNLTVINSLGALEESRMEVGDVGYNWAWTNATGTHIYKYAGSGYEKVREAYLGIDLIRSSDYKTLDRANFKGEAKAPEMSYLTVTTGAYASLSFKYKFPNSHYTPSDDPPLNNNYDIQKINLHTGDSSNFLISESNMHRSYTDLNTIQTGILYTQDLSVATPTFFKLIPYDTISSGVETGNIYPILPTIGSQSIVQSLDPQFDGTSIAVNVVFPILSSSSSPKITQTVAYTGTLGMSYIGSMVSMRPSQSGASFMLTIAPPATGYALYVEVN